MSMDDSAEASTGVEGGGYVTALPGGANEQLTGATVLIPLVVGVLVSVLYVSAQTWWGIGEVLSLLLLVVSVVLLVVQYLREESIDKRILAALSLFLGLWVGLAI
jgi:predicted RND superfamily exporter protein